jgi:hypothetical protein
MIETTKGCPGHAPAPFEVKKDQPLLLQYIMQGNPESQMYKFPKLQFQNPIKGDWKFNF